MLALVGGGARAQAPPAAGRDTVGERSRLERDAAALLQGADTLPFIDPARLRLVAAALAEVRRRLPAVADIPAAVIDQSYLTLTAADSVPNVFVARGDVRGTPTSSGGDFWNAPVARAGIPAIDSLNRVFGVSEMKVRSIFGRSRLVLHFRRPMNIPAVAEAYARVPQVRWAGADPYGGDGSWTALIAKGPRLHFVFARGDGDCMAGCITWDYYYVTYDTAARSVTPDSQLLRATKWPEPVALWDVPTRYDVSPYRTLDDLYAALRDARWWHRQHALVVLGMLLGLDAERWYGPPERRSTDFAALERAAAPRRRDSFLALIERLGDPDPDVAGLSLLYLRELSGAALPGGAAGVAAWRRWLDSR